MVTSSFASAVDPTASAVDDPTSLSDMTAYERNFTVMQQIYVTRFAKTRHNGAYKNLQYNAL